MKQLTREEYESFVRLAYAIASEYRAAGQGLDDAFRLLLDDMLKRARGDR